MKRFAWMLAGWMLVAWAGCLWLAGSARAQPPVAEVEGEDFDDSGEEAVDHAGGDHAGDHAGDGHAAAINPLAFDPDLALFTLLIFLLLLAVLWKFAWGPIAAGLDKREQGIADQIAAAQAANEQAKLLLGQYEQKLAAAAGEVRAILDEARRDAEHTQQEILAKARADARLERDRAIREIEIATDSALKELAERSTNMAVDLAGRIVQAQLKPADHTRLIDEAMAKFPKATAGSN